MSAVPRIPGRSVRSRVDAPRAGAAKADITGADVVRIFRPARRRQIVRGACVVVRASCTSPKRAATSALREMCPNAKSVRDRGATLTAVDGDVIPDDTLNGIGGGLAPAGRGNPRFGSVGDRLERRTVGAREPGSHPHGRQEANDPSNSYSHDRPLAGTARATRPNEQAS
jgi:hypothetical protein